MSKLTKSIEALRVSLIATNNDFCRSELLSDTVAPKRARADTNAKMAAGLHHLLGLIVPSMSYTDFSAATEALVLMLKPRPGVLLKLAEDNTLAWLKDNLDKYQGMRKVELCTLACMICQNRGQRRKTIYWFNKALPPGIRTSCPPTAELLSRLLREVDNYPNRAALLANVASEQCINNKAVIAKAALLKALAYAALWKLDQHNMLAEPFNEKIARSVELLARAAAMPMSEATARSRFRKCLGQVKKVIKGHNTSKLQRALQVTIALFRGASSVNPRGVHRAQAALVAGEICVSLKNGEAQGWMKKARVGIRTC